MNKEYSECYKSGNKAEDKFKRYLQDIKQLKVVKSTEKENIYSHIDYWFWGTNDVKSSVDVKTSDRVTRHLNDNMAWIEIQNVNGKKGWVYGDAEFIAFELVCYWLLVPRKKIVDFIEKYVSDEFVEDKKDALYKKYTRKRYGRDDIITIVKIQDLMFMATRIWKKPEDEYLEYIDRVKNELQYGDNYKRKYIPPKEKITPEEREWNRLTKDLPKQENK